MSSWFWTGFMQPVLGWESPKPIRRELSTSNILSKSHHTMFNLSQLETALAGTIYAGNLHFAPVTKSTNSDALEAARAAAPHGSVYFADEQLSGRGRGNHAWNSAAGQGLYVSVLLRLPIPHARMALLPLAAGLAAASAIKETTGLPIDLRWPNDLLIGPRKTGGILVEATIPSKGLPH